jgi:hypothetical protein
MSERIERKKPESPPEDSRRPTSEPPPESHKPLAGSENIIPPDAEATKGASKSNESRYQPPGKPQPEKTPQKLPQQTLPESARLKGGPETSAAQAGVGIPSGSVEKFLSSVGGGALSLVKLTSSTFLPPALGRAQLAPVDRAFQAVFQVLGLARQVNPPPVFASRPTPTAPLQTNTLSSSINRQELVSKIQEALKETNLPSSVRQNILGTLQAIFVLPSASSPPALNQIISRSLVQFLDLPPDQAKTFFNQFVQLSQTETVRLDLPVIPQNLLAFGIGEGQGVLKNFFQGIAALIDSSFLRGTPQLLPPIFWVFTSALLLKGQGIDYHPFHSPLLDELGALMSRRTRRQKKREKVRLSRTDRVMRKGQSLPVETDAQGEEGKSTYEIESWIKSNVDDEVVGFFWN